MRKNNKIFLLHMLESIERIERLMDGVSQEKFITSEDKENAAVRRLAIIGEAVKNLSKSFKDKHPEIKWHKIAGMRNLLIHEYFGVDLKLTYKIIKEDIPEFKKNILRFLREFK